MGYIGWMKKKNICVSVLSMGNPQILLFFFLGIILMRFTEYIYLPSSNSIALKVSDKIGSDIRPDTQTDESIRVPFSAIWFRNPKKGCDRRCVFLCVCFYCFHRQLEKFFFIS